VPTSDVVFSEHDSLYKCVDADALMAQKSAKM